MGLNILFHIGNHESRDVKRPAFHGDDSYYYKHGYRKGSKTERLQVTVTIRSGKNPRAGEIPPW